MRYLIQIIVMIMEVAIVVFAGVMICERPKEPFTWLLVCLAFKAWYDQGGFMAWDIKNIKKFLANAKDIGL
jgi:hypothetical protein